MTDPRHIALDKMVRQKKRLHGKEVAPSADKTPQPGKKTPMKNHVSDAHKIQDEAAPIPIPVTDESQDRPIALMDQEAKAALRIAISFALPWRASVQRKR